MSATPITDVMIRQYIDAFAEFRVAQTRYEGMVTQLKTVDGLVEFADTEATTFICPEVDLPTGTDLAAAVNERRYAGVRAAALWRSINTEQALGQAPRLLHPFLHTFQ